MGFVSYLKQEKRRRYMNISYDDEALLDDLPIYVRADVDGMQHVISEFENDVKKAVRGYSRLKKYISTLECKEDIPSLNMVISSLLLRVEKARRRLGKIT